MKKNYLFGFGLFLLALFCGESVSAQTKTTTTREIGSGEELKNAIEGVSGVAAAKDELSALKTEMERLKNIADAVSPKYKTVEVKSSAVDEALVAYSDAVAAGVSDETLISYALGVKKGTTGWGGTGKPDYILYVTIPSVVKDESMNPAWSIVNSSFREVTAKACVEALKKSAGGDLTGLYSLAFTANGDAPTTEADAVKITKVAILYKSVTTGALVSSKTLDISNAVGENDRIGMFSTMLLEQCVALSNDLLLNNGDYSTVAERYVTDENSTDESGYMMTLSYKAEYDKYLTAKNSYDTKEGTLGEFSDIKVLALSQDITVANASDFSGLTLPAGVTLDGGNYSITGLSSTPLLAENKGEVVNLIVDGSFAAKNNGYADKVIAKANGKVRLYLENVATDYADAIALVNANNGVYGYDVKAEKIAPVTDANKLYTATYYTADNKGGETFYVNITGENIVSKDSYDTENNQFIYINDSRIAKGTITQKNVVVNGVCSTARIVEGSNTAEFYIPADFTAENLSYDRAINSDVASICLPFTLDNKSFGDKEVYFYGYKGVDLDSKTVWFSKKATAEANKPCVLAFAKDTKPGKIFNELKNVQFKSTVGEELALYPTDQALGESGKRFRGNYKPGQSTGDLAQAAGNLGSEVYGFQNGKLVLLNEQARINQFRSFVIYSVNITKSAGAMLKAGFLDEDGDDVTAVESVNADRNDNGGVKAVGGNGVIEISADKACNVKVYTVGGTFVKSVNVEAGNTSLPVNAGLYIVNKNKVVVK